MLRSIVTGKPGAVGVRYLAYKGPDSCHGCASRLEQYRLNGQQGPPPRQARPGWQRVRTWPSGAEKRWPLCGEHKNAWEAHDAAARRLR